jgi:hypothetical protein
MAAASWKKITVYTLALLVLSFGTVYFWAKYQFATVVASATDVATFVEHAAVQPEFVAAGRAPCNDHNPQKNAYFGELHVHTAVSGDAAAWGILARPADAYKFARGEGMEIRFRSDEPGKDVPVIRLDRPLDFTAVTDHAYQMAEAHICLTPGSYGYGSTMCRIFRGDIALPFVDDPAFRSIFRMLPMTILKNRSQRICSDTSVECLKATSVAWEETQRAAEAAYDRSADCRFTSFVGYEFTLEEQGSNLHRNVIFANATVPPAPLSAAEAKKPEQLWSWLQRNCNNAGVGCDAITIPHNSNWSSGRMFFPYSLSDYSTDEQKRLAAMRNEMEPLAEIIQVKGESECRNGLSRVLGQADEYCNFEKLRPPDEPFEDCLDSVGSKGMQLQDCESRWSYLRYGLIEGLREEKRLGANSFKLGIVSGTDNHSGAPSTVSESNWPGSIGVDYDPKARVRDPIEIPGLAKADGTRFNPGGITGVWAQENTRESLFAAMRQRETFGTSGPRILPRFFAGWNFDQQICNSPELLTQAYANGVPMGGDLPRPGVNDTAPAFLVTAMMDNVKGAAPLQKIQIIKGWTDDDGNMHQEVFDVAGDATSDATVDTDSCERSGSGHASLCALWRDDAFDAAQSAVYYSRVLETPSCRWTAYDCNRFTEAERPQICNSPTLQRVIQERAWSSPIWYSAAP